MQPASRTSRPLVFFVALIAAVALALTVAPAAWGTTAPLAAANGDIVPVGQGGYVATPVGPTPEGCDAIETDPRSSVTTDAPQGPLPTNDWWSSLLYKRLDCRWSQALHAHPVSYLPSAGGLGLSSTRV